ncbi:anaerobic benzoate catabolism transcriptional regulator [compost metagenome]
MRQVSSFFTEVGNTIRLHRKAVKLTQEKLGEILSIDPSYIGKIERGEANTTLDTLLKIADALNISPFELLKSSKKIGNTEKQDLLEKINISLMNLSTHDLRKMSHIIKDMISLIKN